MKIFIYEACFLILSLLISIPLYILDKFGDRTVSILVLIFLIQWVQSAPSGQSIATLNTVEQPVEIQSIDPPTILVKSASNELTKKTEDEVKVELSTVKSPKNEKLSSSVVAWEKRTSGKGMKRQEVAFFDYLKSHSESAIVEMKYYGIPASITLAQALLESNAGRSNLAVKHKNHFGIKCNRLNWGSDCVNYHSDTPDDYFKSYDSVWKSYRSHSKFLQKQRYAKLFELQITDYKGWARILQKAGYSTDPDYAKKLIRIIERWDLHHLDGQV